ncbi:MAG: Mur ligase family protein [Patescibacteria group bacterium]|nr:Mur ligase family protein [Patescibacteria group bacterium]
MRNPFIKILAWKLKILARLTLRRYKPGIVGVTGNVGKTSTKAALVTVLGHSRRVRVSLKSFNNELGLPLTILGDWDSTGGLFFWFRVITSSLFQIFVKNPSYPEILVLEYGVDRPGDMKYLLDVARPHIGVVTALGEIPVHVEFFAGPEAVAQEKLKLVKSLPVTGFSVLNADDIAVLEMKKESRAHPMTFGFSGGVDIRISGFQNHFDKKFTGITFKLRYGGNSVSVRLTKVLSRAHAYAAAAAVAVGLIYGMNLAKIADALSGYRSPPGRLRALGGIKESVIIDDTYNASPVAMHEALDTLRSLKAKRKIAVLGDMLELGKYTIEAHKGAGRLAAKSTDLLFTVGTRAKFIAESAVRAGFPRKKVLSFMSVRECGRRLQEEIRKEDLILVKGSQSVRMERVVKEVMAEPARARELLVRQSGRWLRKRGLYDNYLPTGRRGL